jgi:hypothetical protein
MLAEIEHRLRDQGYCKEMINQALAILIEVRQRLAERSAASLHASIGRVTPRFSHTTRCGTIKNAIRGHAG